MPALLRGRMGEVMVSLPAGLTLPLARERLHHHDWHERFLAENLLAAHAMPEDIPLLRDAIRGALDDDEQNSYGCAASLKRFQIFRAVGRFPS